MKVLSREIQRRYRELLAISDSQIEQVEDLAREISSAIQNGKRIYAFGNGGSAAEAQHFTTELIGRFKGNRRSLPAISLSSDSSALTCIANDFGYDKVFSRQVEGLVQDGDVVVGFTTSGKSANVLEGLITAKSLGGFSVLVTGDHQSESSKLADIVLEIGGEETAIIQEIHLMVIHVLCELIEVYLGLKSEGTIISNKKVLYESEFNAELLSDSKSRVWVNGCFDILHEGHLLLLNTASRAGTELIVGLNSDSSVKSLKGQGRPVISEVRRARTIAQLPFVDLVIIFESDNPLEVLRLVRPNVVVKGGSYAEAYFVEKEFLSEINCQVIFTEQIPDLSTTRIIQEFEG
jgi:rfaE bifunctional protein nucleotidyltransferase chain/domain